MYESYQTVGTLKKSVADELGLNENVKIVIGAGDNAVSAVGTDTIKGGDCNISLGTSGTIFRCKRRVQLCAERSDTHILLRDGRISLSRLHFVRGKLPKMVGRKYNEIIV